MPLLAGQTIRQVQTISQVKVGEGITLELGAAEDIHTSTLFLATGKHDLRGVRRQPQKAPEGLIGFKQHFRLSPAQQREMQGHVDVMLFPDGYAGLLLVEDGIANLCLLAGGGRLARTGGAWPALLQDLQQTEPHLHARLEGAVALEAKPVSISRVPYGFVHAVSSEDPLGVFRLGDQAGVIPSFTGDGMALALHSAVVATSAYLGGLDAAAYHFRIRRDIAGQIGRAAALYRMAHSAAGQKLLMQLAAVWPGSLALAATLTRISPRVLKRAVAQMPALGA
jgi:flavin-dependent dehydrogenase